MVATTSGPGGARGPQSGTSSTQTPPTGQTQQTSSSQPSTFDARFGAQRVAGPSTWAGGSNGVPLTNSTPVPGAAGPLLPNVRISADAVNNDLLIYANQESYVIIKRALEQIDRPQLQVAIDATIAEVTLNDNLQYGVQFFLKSANLGAPTDTGSVVNTAANAALSRVLPGFNFLVGTEAQPQVILNALHSITD